MRPSRPARSLRWLAPLLPLLLVTPAAAQPAADSTPPRRGVSDRAELEAFGTTSITVEDHGRRPLWSDKDYDGIVARIGEKLIAQKGTTLVALDMWTGEPVGEAVNVPGMRLLPVNTTSANLFLVAGNAVIYGFYPR